MPQTHRHCTEACSRRGMQSDSASGSWCWYSRSPTCTLLPRCGRSGNGGSHARNGGLAQGQGARWGGRHPSARQWQVTDPSGSHQVVNTGSRLSDVRKRKQPLDPASRRGTTVALPVNMGATQDTPSSGVEAPVNAGSHRQPRGAPAPPGAPGGDRVPGQTDLLKDLRIITVLMVMRPTGRTTSWIQRALGERSRACTEGLLRAMATAGLISAKSGSRLHTTWHLAAPAIAWLESRPYGHLDP